MKQSAGLLVYKIEDNACYVFLLHPGGPLYAKKDVWSIPKGELEEGEDHLEAAFREFTEEVGVDLSHTNPTELGFSKQKNGKLDYIWALEGDLHVDKLPDDMFTMEWPPRSGRIQEFVENDRAEWFSCTQARSKVFASQRVFIDRLVEKLQAENQSLSFGSDDSAEADQPSLF